MPNIVRRGDGGDSASALPPMITKEAVTGPLDDGGDARRLPLTLGAEVLVPARRSMTAVTARAMRVALHVSASIPASTGPPLDDGGDLATPPAGARVALAVRVALRPPPR